MQRLYKKLLTWQVRDLLIQLQYICNELKDENEIAIIRRYGYNAKYYTIALTGKTISIYTTIFYLIYYYISYITLEK